jgi:hypothetical protein
MSDEQKLTSKDTTETRILITEDRHGNMTVEYQTIIKGTEINVPIRFSHLIGQMFVASIIMLIKNYKRLLTFDDKSKSSSPGNGEKSGEDKKVPETS